MEEDADILSEKHLLLISHFRQLPVAIAYISAVGLHQSYEVLQKYGLSRTAGTDDHVAFARLIFDGYILEDLHTVKTLVEILYLDHSNKALTV